MGRKVRSSCVADTVFIVTEVVRPVSIGGEGEQLGQSVWVWTDS